MSLIGKSILLLSLSGIFVWGEENRMIDKELLDILACPKCKGRVALDGAGAFLVCPHCRVRYPIEEDIPIMLIDRAEPID
jgi:uncharacterized protein YbaR (Trm112 family)